MNERLLWLEKHNHTIEYLSHLPDVLTMRFSFQRFQLRQYTTLKFDYSVRRGCPMFKCMLPEAISDFDSFYTSHWVAWTGVYWWDLPEELPHIFRRHGRGVRSGGRAYRDLTRTKELEVQVKTTRHRKWLYMCPMLLSVQKVWAIVMSTPHKNTLSPAPVCYFQLPCSHIFSIMTCFALRELAEIVVACLTINQCILIITWERTEHR